MVFIEITTVERYIPWLVSIKLSLACIRSYSTFVGDSAGINKSSTAGCGSNSSDLKEKIIIQNGKVVHILRYC